MSSQTTRRYRKRSKPETVTNYIPFSCQILSRLLQLNLLVLLWSLTAILGEYISMQPAALVFWRTALASLFFIAFYLFGNQPKLKISRKHFGLAVGVGFLLGVH